MVRSLLLTRFTALARLASQRVLVRYAGVEIIYLLIDCSHANAPYGIGDRILNFSCFALQFCARARLEFSCDRGADSPKPVPATCRALERCESGGKCVGDRSSTLE